MTSNLFLTTHSSEVGTVLLVEYIWTQKICSYYKSHFLQKKKGNRSEMQFFLYLQFRNSNQVKQGEGETLKIFFKDVVISKMLMAQ